jgi:uncharacterized protein (TIGR02302 family)
MARRIVSKPPDLPRLLARRRAQARRVLLTERIWPALWPALGVFGVWLLFALLDGPAQLPGFWHAGALGLLALAIAGLLWRGLRPLRRPTVDEADRRLEQASGLRHRPLAALADRPAHADPKALALWQAHVGRAAAQLARMRTGFPRPVLARADHRALRGGLLVALVATLVAAGNDALPRVVRSFTPAFAAGAPVAEPQVQAWATPPAYTGLPPVFLKPGVASVTIPAGSKLTIGVTGSSTEPTLSLAGKDLPFKVLDAASWQAESPVAEGALAVRRRGRSLGAWTLAVLPDQLPVVSWAQPPGAAKGNRRQTLLTRLPWQAEDDYGVLSLQAELRLQGRPDATAFVVPIPLPGGAPRKAHGTPAQDLSAHPWAGLPVTARLVAKDAPGQVGRSEEAVFTLPERLFDNALAKAVIDIRKRLSLRPEQHEQAADDLAALADNPEAFDNSSGIAVSLAATAALLGRSGEADDIAEAQGRLWELALHLDSQDVPRTAKAVAAAREELKKGLAERSPPTEMDRKAEALRQAIQKHLQALAEQAKRDGTLKPFDRNEQHLTSQDFNRAAQAMRDAARAGRMDEARDRMADLERMLQQLEQAEANAGKPGEQRQKRAQQQQKGRQDMGAAEDLVQRETGLQARAKQRSEPDAAAERDTEGRQQRAMRRALGEMMQQFGDLTGKVPDGLSDADVAMRDAAAALAAKQDAPAVEAEQRAIDALKKGEQQMSQQMASSLGISVEPGAQPEEGEGGQMAEGQDGNDGDQPGAKPGEQSADSNDDTDPSDTAKEEGQRDPLGRSTKEGMSGRGDAGDVHVPDQMEQARSRDIQQELRRRGADRTRPAGELDYIDRLLKPF